MEPGSDARAHHDRPAEVVCIGLATADTIVPMPAWPSPDGRLLVEPIRRAGGGPAATAAVTIARLGGSAAFVGAVGDGSAGSSLLDELRQAGVRTELAEVRPGRTAESIILLDRSAATRSILHAPGVALESLSADALDACERARWVHSDHAGYALVPESHRARLSVDAGNPIAGLSLDGIALYAPTAESLGRRYPGRPLTHAVAAALAEGARAVAVTCGADGAVGANADGAWRVGGLPIDIASTLGAGDVFHGALLASLLAGHALPEALRRANVAAALSCRALDGRGAIPTLTELEAALSGAPPAEPIMLEEDR